jgi:TolA-binding protein
LQIYNDMEPTTVEQLPFSHKALAWADANRKPVLWSAAGLVLAGLIIGFFIYHHDQREVAAGEAVSAVAVPHLGGGASQVGSAEGYLKVAAEYPGSQGGARALLLAASAYFTEGKYAEARTQFERFRRDYSDSPFVGEALLGMAACLDAQGKTREAMTAYEELINRRGSDYVVPEARFALARLYEVQNEPEKARNLFEEVARTDPYGSLGSEAGMRLEELKEKYPKLAAPAVPPATNPMPYKIEKR